MIKEINRGLTSILQSKEYRLKSSIDSYKNEFIFRSMRTPKRQGKIRKMYITPAFVSFCLVGVFFLSGCQGVESPTLDSSTLPSEMLPSSSSGHEGEHDEHDEHDEHNASMSNSTPEPSSNHSNPDPLSSPFLLVGKGADRFISTQQGEISTLHRGCQGAQHLWVSLRLPQHMPQAYGLELQLVNEEDQLLAPPFTLEGEEWLAYEIEDESLSSFGSLGSELIGLTLVIFDPMKVVGKQALIKSRVFLDEEESVESHLWVEVQWGADAC